MSDAQQIDQLNRRIARLENIVRTLSSVGGSGTIVTDHGALSGLADDDHAQYHNDARAVTWLATKDSDDIAEGVTNLYNQTHTGDVTGATALTIAADAVTYAKMQNVSATDKVLGRATAGAGDVEEIAMTAAGRALVDDANAAAQRTTLGLGTIATEAATAFLRLLGVAGGQTEYGGTGAGEKLTLRGTQHATKGPVIIADDGGLAGFGGNVAPIAPITVNAQTADSVGIHLKPNAAGNDILRFERTATSDYATLEFLTAADARWAIGLRETSDEHLHFYNHALGADLAVMENLTGTFRVGNTILDSNLIGINVSAAANRFVAIGQGTGRNLILGWIYNATAGNAYAVVETYAGANPLILQSGGGNVGIGVTTPQGKFHAHDGTGGWLKKSFTSQTFASRVAVIPNGTGDMLYVCTGTVCVRASDGGISTVRVTNLLPGGSFTLYNDGGTNILLLEGLDTAGANNGAISIRRSAGSLSYSVSLDIHWL